MSRLRLRRALFALTLPVLACTGTERTNAPDEGTQANVPVQITVVHRDERLGVPSFAWLHASLSGRSENAAQAAMATVRGLGNAFALKPEAVAALGEPDVDDSGSGPIVARFQQRAFGLDVFRGALTVALRRDLAPIAASGVVAPRLDGGARAFAIDAPTALAAALRALPAAPQSASRVSPDGEVERFAARGLREPARVKRVFFPLRANGDVELEPAYYVEVLVARGPAHSFVVSALDGRLLFENDLVKNDAYAYRVYADPQTLMPLDGPQGNSIAPHPTGKPDHLKLSWVPSQTVTLANAPFSKNDPWLPPSATKTEGNNVAAYADIADPDGFGAGDVSDDATAPGAFDDLYDTSASPGATTTSIRASITHLFYVTNYLHDWFYDAGFDEKSGNHQKDNLGRGGKANDRLLAEAQDSSGRNNADATVPADGSSPRIQMYIFAGTSAAALTVNSPTAIAGIKIAGTSGGFGKDLFDLTGVVVLGVDDGGSDPNDGCEPLGSVAGKIVLLHRGTCSFAQKAQNAEAAGALGAIIANVATSTSPTVAPFMGGTQPNIHIPVLSLALADGQALEASVTASEAPSVTLKRTGGVDVDGALDTSIVSHEWGHVLSGRLIGNGNGLTTNQAGGLGEGWGDFTSLMLMVRGDDPTTFDGAYTNGAYAMSGAGDDIYFGTRRVPYSIDFTKNPLTFKHVQNGVALPTGVPISFGEDGSSNSEVHNTGEVWASMLWECYAALLRDPRLGFVEAQTRMKRYLVASLKLTPVDPTLLEARDAVLAAAYAGDPADATLFWQAFARRGAGAGAEGPPKESTSNIGVKESFSAGSAAIVTKAVLRDDAISCDHDGVLDEGEVGTIELTLQNAGSAELAGLSARVSSKTPGVTILDDAPTPGPVLKTFASGTFKVKAAVRAAAPLDLVNLDVTLSDPSFAQDQVVTVTVPARYQADEAPETATTDGMETTHSSWTVAGGTKALKWARAEDSGNHLWHVGNGIADADNRLQSPPFSIEGTSLTINFKHRWFFRSSTRRVADFDGGVLEVSVDGGAWRDASDFGAVDYNTTLDTQGRGANPLIGRKAYGNKSPNYPEWVTSHVTLAFPSPPQTMRIRFRAGNGQGFTTSAQGWDVDDIELAGATSKPFWSFIPHQDACDANAPTVNAGPNKTAHPRETVKLEGSGSSPNDLPLTFAWRQIAGPPVVLRDTETATPTFEAPDAAEPNVTVRFEVRANDGALLSPAASVEVKVLPVDATPGSDDGCSCRNAPGSTRSTAAGSLLGASGLLSLLSLLGALRRRARLHRSG